MEVPIKPPCKRGYFQCGCHPSFVMAIGITYRNNLVLVQPAVCHKSPSNHLYISHKETKCHVEFPSLYFIKGQRYIPDRRRMGGAQLFPHGWGYRWKANPAGSPFVACHSKKKGDVRVHSMFGAPPAGATVQVWTRTAFALARILPPPPSFPVPPAGRQHENRRRCRQDLHDHCTLSKTGERECACACACACEGECGGRWCL
ncbi:hypothetical protein B0T17DRAFT_44705 [Bombardia bombarda]|uniref:Uncharacterized protein n=1 Tax=Bombardia bombarda TaxID=252184 RepID=A0AA39XKA5_9PEZI|nr:hypothetical protein B0T17DRAFT_44705 [Bombardia bombarda]